MPNLLKMECSKCRISTSCPRKGSSPMMVDGKPTEYCHIIGGYGREPIDSNILSPESMKARDEGGPCLTLANIPYIDEDTKQVRMELVKVFAPAVLHNREAIPFSYEMIYPKAHKP